MNRNVRLYRVVKSVVKLLSVNLLVISSFYAANTLLFRFQTLLILLLTCVIHLVTYMYKLFSSHAQFPLMKRNQSPEINTFLIDIENGVNANFKPQ
jgi:hypothetical protein